VLDAKLLDALLQHVFKVVDTFSKNTGSRRGNINLTSKCMAGAFVDIKKWITRGNR
jgi:hypothetical protein